MRKDKKRTYPGIQIGTSFMLIVFIILCLVIFATLSLSGSLRDYEYSKKAAQKATDYYHACSLAEQKVGEIDAILCKSAQNSESYEEYIENVTENVLKLQYTEINAENEDTIISFEEKINETQKLLVSLELEKELQANEKLYKIVKWKESPSKGWEEKTTLPVLGSENDKTE